MPFYEYECFNCKKRFESFHSVNDLLTECVKCGENMIKKVPSIITSTVKDSQRQQAGERVKEAIEENRQLLLDALDRGKKETIE